MASLGESAVLSTVDEQSPPRALWRGPRFIAEVFDGADEALAALEAVQSGLDSTGFQTLNWLTLLYEELAPSQKAMPRVVIVTERNSGEVALVLPLLVSKKRRLRVARFADLGVCDYGAPILGRALLLKPRSIRRTWRAAMRAMSDVDLVRLERMPATIAGRPNPLVTRAGLTPSRRSGSVIGVSDSVEDLIDSLGWERRQEIDTRYQAWAKEGRACFYRAETAEECARLFSVLEEQESDKQAKLGHTYRRGEASYRSFYERLAVDGVEAGFVAIFALEAQGEIVATLLGTVHEGTFTVLRAGDDGAACAKFAPDTLIVLEAMKYFVSRGIRRFDFGVGRHPLRDGFGAAPVALFDLIVARDLAAFPRALFHRVKGRIASSNRVRAVMRRFEPEMGA